MVPLSYAVGTELEGIAWEGRACSTCLGHPNYFFYVGWKPLVSKKWFIDNSCRERLNNIFLTDLRGMTLRGRDCSGITITFLLTTV